MRRQMCAVAVSMASTTSTGCAAPAPASAWSVEHASATSPDADLASSKATKNGELAFIDRGEEPVFGKVTRLMEVSVPKERCKEYDGCRLVVNQDLENMMLIRVRIYDHDDHLMEYYGYEDLDLNARLTEADFDLTIALAAAADELGEAAGREVRALQARRRTGGPA